MSDHIGIVADWNLPQAEVASIAKQSEATFYPGCKVDHAIFRGATEVTVRDLGRRGSDHHALLFTAVFPDLTVVRVLWWNVYVGNPPAGVLQNVLYMVDHHQPHIVALGEAYRMRRDLKKVPGYRKYQGLGPGESREIAVLVRRDIEVRRNGWMEMVRDWIGPIHGRRIEGRYYVRLRLKFKQGLRLRFLAAHLPTGGTDGPNKAAVSESINRIIRWAKPRHN